MHLHFDGPPQVRAGLNMTYTALLSTVYYAVKTVVDPTILPNAGLARPLHVTAPEGTVVNCVHPAAVNGRLGTCQRVVDLIFGALAAGGAGARDRREQRRLLLDHLRRPSAEGQCALGLSGNDRRRLRRARDEGRAGRRACAHDQHLEPAGRGAGDRISADAAALRAGGRLRRRRGGIAAAWDCAASIAPRRSAACGWTARALAVGAVGTVRRPARRQGGRRAARRRAAVRPRLGRAAQGRDHRGHHRRAPAATGRPPRAIRRRCGAISPRRGSTLPPPRPSTNRPLEEIPPMRLSRRSLLAAGAALPFLRVPARAATTPGKLVFGLSSYPPNLFAVCKCRHRGGDRQAGDVPSRPPRLRRRGQAARRAGGDLGA